MKNWSLFTAAVLAAASGCVVTPGSSSGFVGAGTGPSHGGSPARPAPAGCAEEFGADASDDFGVAPQVSTPQALDRSFTGCLVPDDHGDVFAILAPPAPAGTLYRISVLGEAGSGVRVELFDGDRTKRIYANATERNGGRAELWMAAGPSSTIYVGIKSPHMSRFRPYDVAITASALPDADEPNDSRDQPTPLALGTPRDALLYAVADLGDRPTDVYRVEVPRAGSLRVVVENVPSEIGLRAEIYDADGKRLRSAVSRNDGATVRLEPAKVSAGSYLVHVVSGGDWRVAGEGETPFRYGRPYRVSVMLD